VFEVTDAWIVGVVAVPVAAGVAILWHRLYDLDLVINRTLVYLGLSAGLLVAYGVTVWLGNLLIGGDSMPATPRMFYGRRDDPYAVMSAVSRGHETPEGPETMLANVVETVARNLALPYAAIELDSDPELGCEWGRRAGAPVAVPLTYGGRRIGSLLITPRTVGGTLTPAERQLLDDLSYQVAVTAHALELSRGLQRSREQLVAAREEERRRLRRDLHDGLGPALAAMTMELDAARNLLGRGNPAAVERLLIDLREQSQAAIADIRRLVYGLRPPSLDELGLVGAITDLTEHFTGALAVSVEAPDELPPLPAAVEVAALRIVQEAVANVASHSGARTCVVRLVVDAAVEIEVIDDGRGIQAGARRGVGLRSMQERAVEVGGVCVVEDAPGGGTRVRARLPLPTG
jgi:signal transduction histidine kinase